MRPRVDRTALAESFPLYWPDGWPRTTWRKPGPYKVSPGQAIDDLRRELRLLGARQIVVSSNVPIRGDGVPYAGGMTRRYDDPGAAVYFAWKDEQYVIACDRWHHVWQNVRACGIAVGAMRSLDRTGATEVMRRGFQGFKALPEGQDTREEPPPRPWWEVLQVSPDASKAVIDAVYKALARTTHPDAGGSDEAMTELNRARDEGFLAAGAVSASDEEK